MSGDNLPPEVPGRYNAGYFDRIAGMNRLGGADEGHSVDCNHGYLMRCNGGARSAGRSVTAARDGQTSWTVVGVPAARRGWGS